MVEEEAPEVADRPQGLLNRRHRRYLLGESDIEPRTQTERDARRTIRQRLYNGLLDFVLVYRHLGSRDIDMAIGDLDTDARLSRDKAIANAMALFLDLGSGEELADASEFERYVERAALLSWRDRHEPEAAGNVWLGEPDVELTVDFPDRIDTTDLTDKVDAVWDRLLELEETDLEGLDGHRGEVGMALGLDSLGSDEILYLTSILLVASDEKKSDLIMVKGVVQAWFVWQQQVRHNLPDSGRDVIQFLQDAIHDYQAFLNREENAGESR